MTRPPPLLQVSAMRCERDERLLFESLDFSVDCGEILQVFGPNGSGKTTMLRALAGISARCEGEIRWRGEPRDKVRFEFRRESLYVGHDAGIKLSLTPIENLRWHCSLWGRTREISLEQALCDVGLEACLEMPAQNLSAGQRRRVGLARLLLSPALLWILDEPFTAIDQQGVSQLEGLIQAHAQGGGAVLLTTHHQLGIGFPVKRLTLGRGLVD
jgi:heme exporter protein A